jgi:predicted lipoprotein with Yx(FWY)xxD motif
MRWTTVFKSGFAAVGAAVVLAGCSGTGDGGAEADTAPASGAAVSVRDVPGVGKALTDPDGMTLYFTDQEAGGAIKCQDGCVSFWKPLTVESGASPAADGDVTGTLATVTRPDGDVQLTLNGMPLYTFAQDSPGEAKGDGFQDEFDGTLLVWHAAMPNGSSAATGSAPPSVPSSDDFDYNY